MASGGMMKRILGIGVALPVALGAGWAWGASGRVDLNRALQLAELRDGLLEGRAAVLDARLEIYSVNFGEASRHLEAARSALRAADARLNDLGRREDAERLQIALTRIDEAQLRAGQLNQDANALAADAAKTINAMRRVSPSSAAMAALSAAGRHARLWVHRKRPFLRNRAMRVIGRRPGDSSFPSSHAALAFAGSGSV